MNTTTTEGWIPITGSSEPRDQQMDLHNGYWAEIGPDRGTTWSWAVMEITGEGWQEDVESGLADSEPAAKAAVADWAEDDLLVAEIAEDLLSAAFTAYGHTPGAVDAAERAVTRTTQIGRA